VQCVWPVFKERMSAEPVGNTEEERMSAVCVAGVQGAQECSVRG